MSISLRQIRYFVSTAEHGQVSQAALDLAISQSAITTAIQQIERTIGADLFTRSQQGMELTPAGQQFLFHAYDIINKVAEALSESSVGLKEISEQPMSC
jgi:DNA-binding transcriptional LysR family regulator